MKTAKILIAFALFPLLAVQLAGAAAIGVAIAPATGTFDVPLDGAELEFTVYNTGGMKAPYTLEIGGAAAEFSSAVENNIMIPANDYRTFNVKVDPSKEVKAGDAYGLTVKALIASSGNVITGAESKITLSFSGVRTRPYPPEEAVAEAKLPEVPEKEPARSVELEKNIPMAEVPQQASVIPLGFVLPVLIGMIVAGVAFVFIKKTFH